MDKVLVAWVRGIACVVTLACLSACNSDDMGSSVHASQPPLAQRPPREKPPILHPPGTPDPVTPGPTPDPEPGNVAPQIAGHPGTDVVVGHTYSFTPNASDPDGDTLTFSIDGKPSWASFDHATGRLAGTPGAADVGSHENITIAVTDGAGSQTLAPFAINVVQQSNGSVTLAWQAPTENTDGSPLTNLQSYKIHYGTQSGHYSATISVNNSSLTRYVVENLVPGTYFFAITAVSANGAESDPSAEASKTI